MRKAEDILCEVCGKVLDDAERSYGYKGYGIMLYEGYDSYEQAVHEKSSAFYNLFRDYLSEDALIDTQKTVSEMNHLLEKLEDYDDEER